jgi:TatD family-associated radical SAM protein
LEHQPTFEEIKENLAQRDLGSYRELVFCGYGEPTCELELLLETAKYIKCVLKVATPIRVNTNGLSDLVNNRSTAEDFTGMVDTVSISLNAPNIAEYTAVTRPSFGEESFGAMLKFAEEVKQYVPQVMFTVVDVIGEEKIEQSRKLAESIGIKLRVRELITD